MPTDTYLLLILLLIKIFVKDAQSLQTISYRRSYESYLWCQNRIKFYSLLFKTVLHIISPLVSTIKPSFKILGQSNYTGSFFQSPNQSEFRINPKIEFCERFEIRSPFGHQANHLHRKRFSLRFQKIPKD